MRPTDDLPGFPFVWRRAGDNPAPLNADIRPTRAPNVGGTPRQLAGFGANNGTMHGLSPRADKLLAVRPDHRVFKIGTPGSIKTAQHKPAEHHGGAYSKAKAQKVAA